MAFGIAVLLAAGFFAVGFYYGRQWTMNEYGDLGAINHQLIQALDKAKKEVDILQSRAAQYKLSSEVDRQAAETVRIEIRDLNNTIAELEEAVAFYKGVMDPDKNKRGLSIASFEVFALKEPNRYSYKLVVVQLSGIHRLLRGHVVLQVVGVQAGQSVVLSLKQLSPDVDVEKIKLRFKYFQEILGEIVLPEDFVPERVNVVATSAGKHGVTVEQKFDWQFQEN